MTQVNLELPETIYSVLHCSPGEPDKELRLAASAQWYQQGRISQEWAAGRSSSSGLAPRPSSAKAIGWII